MSRAPRVSYPGATHHVTARGVGRDAIFRSEYDYSALLTTLNDARAHGRWTCLAYCLMPNHLHLLLRMADTEGLSRGMQFLNGRYGSGYNSRHGRTGHVFQGRFHDELVRRDSHLLECIRYIALNPVRARLVAQPEGWRWSSHAETAGMRPTSGLVDVASVLRLFGADLATARQRYSDFVADGAAAGARPSLGDVLGAAPATAVAVAHRDYGYTQSEIATYLGVSQATVSRMIRRAADRE